MNYLLIMDLFLFAILITLTVKLILFLLKIIKARINETSEITDSTTEIYGKTVDVINVPMIVGCSFAILIMPFFVFLFIVATLNSH